MLSSRRRLDLPEGGPLTRWIIGRSKPTPQAPIQIVTLRRRRRIGDHVVSLARIGDEIVELGCSRRVPDDELGACSADSPVLDRDGAALAGIAKLEKRVLRPPGLVPERRSYISSRPLLLGWHTGNREDRRRQVKCGYRAIARHALRNRRTAHEERDANCGFVWQALPPPPGGGASSPLFRSRVHRA